MAHIYCMVNVSGQDEEILDALSDVMRIPRAVPCLFYLTNDTQRLRPAISHRDRAETYSKLEDRACMFECGNKPTNIPVYISSVIGNVIPKIKQQVAKMDRMDDVIVLLATSKKERGTYDQIASFWVTTCGIDSDSFYVLSVDELEDSLDELRFSGKVMASERKELKKRIRAQM
jgi:hypothetical protein